MKPAIRVLKATDVEVTGTYSLASGTSSCPTKPGATQTKGTAQAKIIEQHPQYAILEITCACGLSMQVKCDYSQTLATS